MCSQGLSLGENFNGIEKARHWDFSCKETLWFCLPGLIYKAYYWVSCFMWLQAQLWWYWRLIVFCKPYYPSSASVDLAWNATSGLEMIYVNSSYCIFIFHQAQLGYCFVWLHIQSWRYWQLIKFCKAHSYSFRCMNTWHVNIISGLDIINLNNCYCISAFISLTTGCCGCCLMWFAPTIVTIDQILQASHAFQHMNTWHIKATLWPWDHSYNVFLLYIILIFTTWWYFVSCDRSVHTVVTIIVCIQMHTTTWALCMHIFQT
jgi:hypothetical protein